LAPAAALMADGGSSCSGCPAIVAAAATLNAFRKFDSFGAMFDVLGSSCTRPQEAWVAATILVCRFWQHALADRDKAVE